MIKRIIKGIVLAVFFAGALLISNYVMNRGTDDKIMTMGEPTLPVVSFTVSGQEINLLSGYVDQMDVTAMRDTITPLESNGTLQAEIAENGNKISKISYKVYSLDGADTYNRGTPIKDPVSLHPEHRQRRKQSLPLLPSSLPAPD